MSPCSAPVLGGAALLASSALYQALVERTLTLEVALTRYLVAVALAWVALSAVVMLVGSPMTSQAGGSATDTEPPVGPGAPGGRTASDAASAPEAAGPG
ncbi:MAG: hypothetical protein JWN84_3246 [Nocardioides sp.]|nr:hypothetical protein [Nocardioides sp.]